ncbi:MAG TPA: carbohydrate kinase family protein, partial [Candidatus Woesearchaeota archaeon]|nr:carbohydrate kinase family protein [Candidatus Woesearchaeota archaeon]
MYDVITMGSNTLDIFVHTDQSEIIGIRSKTKKEELISYPVGTKMLITKLMHNFGGNGANTAVAFSRLGLKTAYLGKIGKDTNGRLILQSLKKEGVDFIGARGLESGFSIILDSIEHDRTILTYKGCNNELKFSEVKKAKLKTRWFYLSTMLGESLRTMQRIAEYAHGNNIRVAFN